MGAIDCPLYHYLYDLRTGANRYPRNVFPADLAADVKPLPLYLVQEEDVWILVGRMKDGPRFGMVKLASPAAVCSGWISLRSRPFGTCTS